MNPPWAHLEIDVSSPLQLTSSKTIFPEPGPYRTPWIAPVLQKGPDIHVDTNMYLITDENYYH